MLYYVVHVTAILCIYPGAGLGRATGLLIDRSLLLAAAARYDLDHLTYRIGITTLIYNSAIYYRLAETSSNSRASLLAVASC